MLLTDLEDLDTHLAAVNLSSFVVASYLRLAALENQSREVQVAVQRRPLLETQRDGADAVCLLQAMVAEKASASRQPGGLEEQLGLLSLRLGVLLQQVRRHL